MVLLEKAESQQQCIALKKENVQIKQEAEVLKCNITEIFQNFIYFPGLLVVYLILIFFFTYLSSVSLKKSLKI